MLPDLVDHPFPDQLAGGQLRTRKREKPGRCGRKACTFVVDGQDHGRSHTYSRPLGPVRQFVVSFSYVLCSLYNAYIPMLKISVLSSGAILLDGNPVDMEQLEDSLKKAKEANDVVWYYREASAAAPPPQAMQVIQLVVKHKLIVTLSSKPDFSDY